MERRGRSAGYLSGAPCGRRAERAAHRTPHTAHRTPHTAHRTPRAAASTPGPSGSPEPSFAARPPPATPSAAAPVQPVFVRRHARGRLRAHAKSACSGKTPIPRPRATPRLQPHKWLIILTNQRVQPNSQFGCTFLLRAVGFRASSHTTLPGSHRRTNPPWQARLSASRSTTFSARASRTQPRVSSALPTG
ncbi:hypothetical protein DF041_11125 [Burkholderia cepacia]|nr:hypothetical protein DF041_11125 [Burkholderia cepacia]